MVRQSFIALGAWILLGGAFYLYSIKSASKVSKRDMDYFILGNVQVVRGLRKDAKEHHMVEGQITMDV